jgi:hypothetical protein
VVDLLDEIDEINSFGSDKADLFVLGLSLQTLLSKYLWEDLPQVIASSSVKEIGAIRLRPRIEGTDDQGLCLFVDFVISTPVYYAHDSVLPEEWQRLR